MTVGGAPRSLGAVAVDASGPTADALLLARILAGDDAALAIVYDQHAGLVYGLARRVTRDEQLARDITQDVFTYLWELPGRVDLRRGSIRSFLAVVAHRWAVDEVRRSERRGIHPLTTGGARTGFVPGSPAALARGTRFRHWQDRRRAERCEGKNERMLATSVEPQTSLTLL